MSIKTANYILTRDVTCFNGYLLDPKVVPQGSFVKPVDVYYVPHHIIELPENRLADFSTNVFCYTRIGFVLIPREYLREV